MMKAIIHFVRVLYNAWMEARSEQAKYYSKHGHIE
jgi:hypothetical protein